jgi:hypothetical protein
VNQPASQQASQPANPPPATRSVTPVVILVSAAWAATVVLSYIARQRGLDVPGLCMFRQVTTLPCPGCGGTRAAFSLARLDLPAAIAFNPLITALLLGAPIFIAYSLWRRRRPPMSHRARRTWMTLIITAFAINWVWVLHHEGVF